MSGISECWGWGDWGRRRRRGGKVLGVRGNLGGEVSGV